MKRVTAFTVLSLLISTIVAQVPQGINYQAVARDGQGNVMENQSLTVKLTVYSDETAVWTEEHVETTNKQGLFSLVIGDPDVSGSGTAESFDLIDWGTGFKEIGIELDDGNGMIDLGRAPLQSVPFALYAANGGGNEAILQDLSLTGTMLSLSDDPTPDAIDLSTLLGSGGTGWDSNVDTVSSNKFVGIGTSNTSGSLLAVQGLNNQTETPLFEVRREDGVPVFAVFNDGVMVYVDEDAEQKGVKGGFAVGGYKKANKGLTQEYLRVTPDSVRIYVPEDEQAKGVKGGFAVGGYKKANKGVSQDLLFVTPDSIRLYVPDKENDPNAAGLQGGFAVETFDPLAVEPEPREYIMGMNRGITRFNTADNRKGFAIGSQGEGWSSTYMKVTPVNTFVGFGSGANTRNDPDAWNADQGSMNVFLGYQSGERNIYGHHNVFMGYRSGWDMVGDSLDDFNASYNLIMGSNAGEWLSTGSSNIFLGSFSGGSTTNSEGNIFIGEYAGQYSIGSSGNIAIGKYSGEYSESYSNVFIGNSAGSNNINGNSNVMIGPYAGANATGSNNVFIGKSAGYWADSDNTLYIENSNATSPLIYGDFANDILKFNAEVAINGNPDGNRLLVYESRASHYPAAIQGQNEATSGVGAGVEGIGGLTGVRGYAYQSGGTGSRYGLYGYAYGGEFNYGVFAYASGTDSYAVYSSGSMAYTGSLVAASDQKFKEDVKSISSVMGMLMQVKPRTYNVIGSEETKAYGLHSTAQYGFVAQELEQVFPELVIEVNHPENNDPKMKDEANQKTDSYKGVKYIEMIPLLLKGMQEQQAEIEALKLKIVELEAK